MNIQELQSTAKDTMMELITSVKQQWQDGQIDEENYHYQMAVCCGKNKRVGECLYHASKLHNSPNSWYRAEANTAVARMLVGEQDLDEAIVYYEKALLADPKHQKAIEEMAECHLVLKQYKEAETGFRKALEKEPTEEALWDGLAISLAATLQCKEAISCFEKGMQFQSDRTADYYYEYKIGLCYSIMGDFYRGLAHYTKSIKAKPSCAHAFYGMAVLYSIHDNDIKNAAECYQKAESLAQADFNYSLLHLIYQKAASMYHQVKEFELRDDYLGKLKALIRFARSEDEQ